MKTTFLCFGLLMCFFIVSMGAAQTKNASAILQLDSTTQGALVPRMTEAERNAIANPVDGLLVFNTTNHQLSFYNASSSSWLNVMSDEGGASPDIVVTAIQISGVTAQSGALIVPYSYSVTGGVEDKNLTQVKFYQTDQYGQNPTLRATYNGVATGYGILDTDFISPTNYLIIGVTLQGKSELFSTPYDLEQSELINTNASFIGQGPQAELQAIYDAYSGTAPDTVPTELATTLAPTNYILYLGHSKWFYRSNSGSWTEFPSGKVDFNGSIDAVYTYR